MERACRSCSVALVIGDPHEHCIQHCPCFINGVFDPRQCSPCNEIFVSAKRGSEISLKLWRTRLDWMGENSQNSVLHPEAIEDYTLIVEHTAGNLYVYIYYFLLYKFK